MNYILDKWSYDPFLVVVAGFVHMVEHERMSRSAVPVALQETQRGYSR